MNKKPVISSTIGYRTLIFVEQYLHLALRSIQLKIGIFKYHFIFSLQFGQKLLGFNIDISLGNLKITTLRKLPMHIPIKNFQKLSIK
tara:strand:+ start:120 stop:380 length:261 start_codon:yes stop_codon:yes gene_type:complete